MKTSIGAKEIVFPTPVFIVGTYCEDGTPNAMNVAWGGICSSNPPCIAISIRSSRCTYDNISNREAFTINIPSETYKNEADYFGIVTGKKVDKFKVTGLTAVKSEYVDAPYIEEFPLNLECKLVASSQIGEHTQFIGEILNVRVNEDCRNEKGLPDIGAVKPLIFDPVEYNYYNIGDLAGKAFSIGKIITSKDEIQSAE